VLPSQQLDLLDPVSQLCDEALPATSIYAFLHGQREVLFPDGLFAICSRPMAAGRCRRRWWPR